MGSELADSRAFPAWRDGVEFKAIREASLAGDWPATLCRGLPGEQIGLRPIQEPGRTVPYSMTRKESPMKKMLIALSFTALALPAAAQVPDTAPVQMTEEQRTEVRERMQSATSAEERAEIRSEYGLGQGQGGGQGAGGQGIHDGPMDGSGNQYKKGGGQGQGKGRGNSGW